jgi:hypothetical protein
MNHTETSTRALLQGIEDDAQCDGTEPSPAPSERPESSQAEQQTGFVRRAGREEGSQNIARAKPSHRSTQPIMERVRDGPLLPPGLEEGRGYSTPEAAEYLGVSVSYLNKLRCVSNSGPEFTKIGRRVTYTLPALERFRAQRRFCSTSEYSQST